MIRARRNNASAIGGLCPLYQNVEPLAETFDLMSLVVPTVFEDVDPMLFGIAAEACFSLGIRAFLLKGGVNPKD